MRYKKNINKFMALILSIAMALTLFVAPPAQAEGESEEMGGYLWAFFNADGGYEKIFFGYSKDGLIWQKLNKDADGTSKPILANDAPGSDKGVRDPHIIRSNDGTKYWILGTDLHAEGGGEGGSGWDQENASKNIVVWESEDLINWSEPKLVYSGFDNAGCVWAPEAIYDEANDEYVVYWSIRDKSLVGTDKNALRVYVCRTKDFTSFTTPKVWLSEDENSGEGVNIIDSTIVYDGEYYYRFSTSDWYTIVDRSRTLDTEDVFDVTVDRNHSTPNGSWERIVTRSGYADAGFDRREGFTVYQLPDGRWCAMGDNGGYAAFVTDDLSSGKFTRTSSAAFIDGAFRHGTVMRLTKDEEKRLLEAYGQGLSEGGGTLDEEEAEEPVLAYDFESGTSGDIIPDVSTGNEKADNATMHGNANVEYDSEKDSTVLRLNGQSGSYVSFPTGFFDYRDTMTICMDVKSEMDSGNFFTFTYGKNSTVYDFLRIRGSEVRNAVTLNSYGSEQEVSASGAATGQWQNVVIVIDKTTMKLYINGKLVSENNDTGILTSYMGTNLLGYLGRSFYDADQYFRGSFDNIKIYNRALNGTEIVEQAGDSVSIFDKAVIGTAPDRQTALTYRGTDYHTSVYSKVDKDKKSILPYVKTGTDVKDIPVYFDVISDSVEITLNGESFVNGSKTDLSRGAKVIFTYGEKTEEYSIKPPVMSSNSVLPGQYADPDIDYFDGKFWIFPTTDGYPGWSGTLFHAWSSKDLTDWTDEGVIMELKNPDPGVNEKGIQIATSDWAVGGSAWAPTIEKKNGKYYFYYCGKDENGTSQIGVASADKPEGPYTDLGKPLVTVEKCRELGVSMGQAIDPSIFTDDDGTSYMTFGNGSAAIVTLGDDMMSIDESSMRQINGLTDFRESVVVIKKDGRYHWTWTCDDANSPNYHVNYGISDTLYGNITVIHRPLLAKNENIGILGTGHQSLVHVKDGYNADRYFMAYHRFYSPINIFTSSDGLGVHRETCIDEVTFDSDGYMNIVTPTHEGVTVYMGEETEPTQAPTDEPTQAPTDEPTAVPTDEPTAVPTDEPTQAPTDEPTQAPTNEPTQAPTNEPTAAPSDEPTAVPTDKPSTSPTDKPATSPSAEPTQPATPPAGNGASAAPAGTGSNNDKTASPIVKLKGKSKVKRGKSIVIKVSIANPDGSKVKWSLNKKGKKLLKLVKKNKTSVKIKAKNKKGKAKLVVKYGDIKVTKVIKVK